MAEALGDHRRWVAELKAFYQSGTAKAERKEDLMWQRLAGDAVFRDD